MTPEAQTLRDKMYRAIETGNPESFFGNFRVRFPFPEGWTNEREMARLSGTLHRKYGDDYTQDSGLSEFFLELTREEHFANIDKAIEQHNFDIKEIQQLMINRSRRQEFYAEVAPEIYLQLRSEGYSHDDLTF